MTTPASRPWPAPAKLNLMLHIVGRRADGYHLLQTVFQFLDLGDELCFQVRPDGLIRRRKALAGVPEEHDLVIKAARLLQREGGVSAGADIHLRKRLPMGGGLGGGSSDAATTLVALNRLWDIHMEPAGLAELGLRLGADVPIFVHGRAAWAEGVGERLTPIEPPEPWYLILVPQCEVSTAEIFSDPDLTRDSPRITIRDFLDGRGRNDCTAVVRRRYPKVAEALDWLDGFAPARLTGTGACLFAAFEDRESARRVLDQLPTGLKGWVARGMNRSPLHDRLSA